MSDDEKRQIFGAGGQNDAKAKDWGGDAVKKAGAIGVAIDEKGKGAPGGLDKGKGKGKGKGQGKGGFGAFGAKFQNMSPEDRDKMKTATPEERTEILKRAGFTDEELQQMQPMRQGGGGGGVGGPGGGG